MIQVNRKKGESIDKFIKRFSRRFSDSNDFQEIMKRRFYTKPSKKRRAVILDAIYRKDKKLAEKRGDK